MADFTLNIGATVSNTLPLSQWTNPTLTGDATSQLTLGHTASATASKVASNTLVLEQQAACTINRFVSARSTFSLHQAASLTRIIGGTVSQYSPFVGSSTDPNTPEPPPTSLLGPMAGIEVPFQLVYPATGVVTDSVSLKTPNLGNKDRLAFRRVMRETRGGTLIVFADPIWPRIETLVLQFSGLLRVEAQNLLTFIEAHLGREVGLIDWEHHYWRGVITSPDEPIVEDRFDSFSASFEFEGTLDPTWNPQVVPPILRYSAIRSPQAGGYYVANEPMPPVLSEAIDYHAMEADSSIKIGQPVYLTSVGHVNPARASAAGTTQVAEVATIQVTHRNGTAKASGTVTFDGILVKTVIRFVNKNGIKLNGPYHGGRWIDLVIEGDNSSGCDNAIWALNGAMIALNSTTGISGWQLGIMAQNNSTVFADGAFISRCHRNGIRATNGGVANIRWGTISGTYNSALYAMAEPVTIIEVDWTATFSPMPVPKSASPPPNRNALSPASHRHGQAGQSLHPIRRPPLPDRCARRLLHCHHRTIRPHHRHDSHPRRRPLKTHRSELGRPNLHHLSRHRRPEHGRHHGIPHHPKHRLRNRRRFLQHRPLSPCKLPQPFRPHPLRSAARRPRRVQRQPRPLLLRGSQTLHVRPGRSQALRPSRRKPRPTRNRRNHHLRRTTPRSRHARLRQPRLPPNHRTHAHDWNNLLAAVNNVLENPPTGTDCSAITPLLPVTENHRWSKSDIAAVHAKLLQTNCGQITFSPIPDKWSQSILDEINAALPLAWCDCPGTFTFQPEVIAIPTGEAVGRVVGGAGVAVGGHGGGDRFGQLVFFRCG